MWDAPGLLRVSSNAPNGGKGGGRRGGQAWRPVHVTNSGVMRRSREESIVKRVVVCWCHGAGELVVVLSEPPSCLPLPALRLSLPRRSFPHALEAPHSPELTGFRGSNERLGKDPSPTSSGVLREVFQESLRTAQRRSEVYEEDEEEDMDEGEESDKRKGGRREREQRDGQRQG
ncbi:hypothetical protein O3P69_002359 [Scylla paramamosain]|uniref:Uncharacterized protein n=1 Tax=Scylla paramamosain TaxID=85552 RepID=A0AAW0V5Z2_SCYPA